MLFQGHFFTIFSAKTTDVNGNDVVFDGAYHPCRTTRKSGSEETAA